jgi:hypothetical protein
LVPQARHAVFVSGALLVALCCTARVVFGVSRRPRIQGNRIGRSSGGCKRLTNISAMALVIIRRRDLGIGLKYFNSFLTNENQSKLVA